MAGQPCEQAVRRKSGGREIAGVDRAGKGLCVMTIMRRWWVAAAAGCATMVLGIAAPSSAGTDSASHKAVAPGGQLWARTFDGHGGIDMARSVAVSPGGQMVFVKGITNGS